MQGWTVVKKKKQQEKGKVDRVEVTEPSGVMTVKWNSVWNNELAHAKL